MSETDNIWSQPLTPQLNQHTLMQSQIQGVMQLVDIERQRNEALVKGLTEARTDLGAEKLKHAQELIDIERRHQKEIDRKNEEIARLREKISELNADVKIKDYEIEKGQPKTAMVERLIETGLPLLGAFMNQQQPQHEIPASAAPMSLPPHSGDGMARQLPIEQGEPQLSVNHTQQQPTTPEEMSAMNQAAVAQNLLNVAIPQLQGVNVNKDLIAQQFEQITNGFTAHTRQKIENATWIEVVKALATFAATNNIDTSKVADIVEAVLRKIAGSSKGFDLTILAKMGGESLFGMVTNLYGSIQGERENQLIKEVFNTICNRVLETA